MKNKFGILDVLIILMLVVLTIVGTKMVLGNKTVTTTNQEISFTIEIKSVEEELLDKIKENDFIYNSSNDILYGEVTNIEIKPSTEIVANLTKGEYTTHTYSELKDVYLTIKGTADSISDKHITIAENEIKIGSLAHISGTDYVSSGYIVKMDRLEVEGN